MPCDGDFQWLEQWVLDQIMSLPTPDNLPCCCLLKRMIVGSMGTI
jgi:hypothetical protein